MPISLPTLRSIAAEVASEEKSGFSVLGTTKTEGSADFAEVLYGHSDPETRAALAITVKRRVPEAELRDVLRRRLRAHIRKSA